MNIVILVGRLTKDPEVRYTPSQMEERIKKEGKKDENNRNVKRKF